MWDRPTPRENTTNYKYQNYMNNKKIRNLDNFILLKISINHIDQLLLKEPIHFRRRWLRENEWKEEQINP